MNLSVKEAAVALQIKESLLRKYIFYNQIKRPKKSLSNNLFYTLNDLKTIASQILILRAKNQGYFKKREVK